MSKRIKVPKLSSQEALDRKIRRMWTLSPVTKVVPSKRLYNRKEKHKGLGTDDY